LHLTLPATTARVLEFEQLQGISGPVVLGSAYSKLRLDSTTLTISGVQGESGTLAQLAIVMPPTVSNITHVVVNNHKMASVAGESYRGLPAVILQGTWAGRRFSRSQEVPPQSTSDGAWKGVFEVPQSAIDQLKARNVSYPIIYNTDPEDTDDANLPWLAPGRLLIFVKYPIPIDDTFNITGDIDGQPLLVRKAYNTIVRNAGRFIGHWADVTPLVKPDTQQTLTLQLPGPPAPGMPLGVFFDNVETLSTTSLVMSVGDSLVMSTER